MHIFELMWDRDAPEKSTNPYKERIDPNTLGNTLASVDQRFRRIALSTAILWSIVTDIQSMEVRATNLARSKNVGIHVYLFDETDSTSSDPVYNQLLIHSHRWESLCIGIHWAHNYLNLLLETQQNLMLPSLRSLYIHGLSDDELYGSYVDWNMPKLVFLRLYDVVLTPSSGPSLVRCELDFMQ